MKSSLKIDVNHLDGGLMYPVIKLSVIDSDDPRDAIAKSFVEQLGYESSWLRITPKNDHNNSFIKDYVVTPETSLEKIIQEASERLFSCRTALSEEESIFLKVANKLLRPKDYLDSNYFSKSTLKMYDDNVCEVKDALANLKTLDTVPDKLVNQVKEILKEPLKRVCTLLNKPDITITFKVSKEDMDDIKKDLPKRLWEVLKDKSEFDHLPEVSGLPLSGNQCTVRFELKEETLKPNLETFDLPGTNGTV